MQVLTMNAPSSEPSIKYSFQCALIASVTEADGASAVTRYACLDDIVSCESSRPSSVSSSQFLKESVDRNERCGSKIHVKTLAPDRDSPVLPEVHGVWHVIILISDIPFQNTEIDERRIFHGCVVLSVRRRDQIDVNV